MNRTSDIRPIQQSPQRKAASPAPRTNVREKVPRDKSREKGFRDKSRKWLFRNKGAPLFLHYTYCLHLLLHERTVTRVRLHLSNLVHYVHAFRDLAERRVLAV